MASWTLILVHTYHKQNFFIKFLYFHLLLAKLIRQWGWGLDAPKLIKSLPSPPKRLLFGTIIHADPDKTFYRYVQHLFLC